MSTYQALREVQPLPSDSPLGICKAGCGSSLPSSSHSALLGFPVWLFELCFSTLLCNEALTFWNNVLSFPKEHSSHDSGKTLPQERQSHSCPWGGDSQHVSFGQRCCDELGRSHSVPAHMWHSQMEPPAAPAAVHSFYLPFGGIRLITGC